MKKMTKKLKFLIICGMLVTSMFFSVHADDNLTNNKTNYLEQQVLIDDVTVKLKAPEGSIPEDAILSVKKVTLEKKFLFFSTNASDELGVSQKELNKIEKAVNEEKEYQHCDDKKIESSYIFDISLINANGKEIEPSQDVEISFSKNVDGNQTIKADIYHITENIDHDLEATLLDTNNELFNNENIATTTTDSFSYYTVEFVYNNLQYVLKGGESVALSDILSTLQLQGDVSSVAVSNDKLIQIENNENEWIITSLQSFNTNEWLKIVINNNEYTIQLTDPTVFTWSLENNTACSVTASFNVSCGSGTQTMSAGSDGTDSTSYTSALTYDSCNPINVDVKGTGCPGVKWHWAGSKIVVEPDYICTPGDTAKCGDGIGSKNSSNYKEATLTIKNCHSSDITKTRIKPNGTETCADDGNSWVCAEAEWNSCITMPNDCSKSGYSTTKTITFNGNGGSPDTGSTSSTESYGYTFDGWGANAGCITSNSTATATYTRYVSSARSKMYATGASRTGYTFLGWDTSPSGTNIVYSQGSELPWEDMTLYAVWQYKVDYYSDPTKSIPTASTISTHTGSTNQTTHIYGASSSLANSGFTTACYNVKNWNTNSELTGTNYTPGQSVTNIPGSSNPRSLYAVWQANTYKLKYNANGGTNAPADDTKTYDTDFVMTSSIPTRKGYEFIGWSYNQENKDVDYPVNNENHYSETYATCSDVNLYAKWKYKLKNNSYVEISGTAEGVSFDLMPGQESDYFFPAGSDTPTVKFDNRKYYDAFINEDDGSIGIYIQRKVQTLTFDVYNDNGYEVIDTVSISATDVDLEGGDKLNHDILPTNSDASIGDFTHSQAQKNITVSANSHATLTFSAPEGSHLTITSTNNSSVGGFSNTKDYITLVETPEMYSTKNDYERENYQIETELDYIVFKSQEDDKNINRETMVLDNQYQRTSYGFTSENNATFKLYECLTDACTVKYEVQATEHDVNNNYYAQTISSEIEGESKYLDTKTGLNGQWDKLLDVHKNYKLVQETLIKNKYYSWDSGYEITTLDYTGYNSGSGTQELNYLSEAIKIDVDGTENEPTFAGNTIKTGSGGSLVTSVMKQPYTEVSVRTVTGSGVPVSDVEMYFGAATDAKPAYKNVYVSAPTTKEGITFSSNGGSGKALQPDIEYSGYLGGSWITDLSGNYAPFNGYLANNSWYKEIELPMPHYQDKEQIPTKFNLVIDTAKLTLKAKADIGNVNAKFDVLINNAQFSYGEEGKNGEMIRSSSAIVMHLGSDVAACSGDEIGTVCKDGDYYSYTIDVPTDKLITVKHDDNNAVYYKVKQTCDVDTDKYACRSYVPENTSDDHIEYFDLTRKSAEVSLTAELKDLLLDKDIINKVTMTLDDSTNKETVCDVDNIGDYCDIWDETTDWSDWSKLDPSYTDIDYDAGTNKYVVDLKPTRLTTDSDTIVIPAGLIYDISVENRKANDWLSNFLNGLFKDEDSVGYKTTVDVPHGISEPDKTQNVRVVTSSYQYARFNVNADKGINIDIFDKNSDLANTLKFVDTTSLIADLQYDLSPYTFSQGAATKGYYAIKDVVSETAVQDGEYTIDIVSDKIYIDIIAVGTNDGHEYPMSNVAFAIGEDADNIVMSGYTTEDGTIHASGLEPDKTYTVYFAGNVVGTTVENYIDEKQLVIPASVPEINPSVKGELPLVKKTVSVNDIYGTQKVEVKVLLDDYGWSYEDFDSGVATLNIEDGKTQDILVPENANYSVEPEIIHGYSCEVSEEPESNLIEIEYTIKNYEINIKASSNVGTKFVLKKNGETIANNNTGDFGKYIYTVLDTYTISADTPYGYQSIAPQNVSVSFDNNDIATAGVVKFNFKLGTLVVNVTNIISGTNVKLHNAHTGETVETYYSKNSNDVTFYTTCGDYYVTVDWPSEYYKNNTHYQVETSGLDYSSGKAVAPTIKPARNKMEDLDEYFIVRISSEHENEKIKNVEYAIYYQGTENVALNINDEKLDSLKAIDEELIVYLSPKNKYDVKQISVPKKYKLSEEIIKLQATKEQISSKKSVAQKRAEVVFNNELSDVGKSINEQKIDITNKCNDARNQLTQEFQKLDRSKYSKKQWTQIEEQYKAKLKEINTKCSALDEEINNAEENVIVYSFDTLFADILALVNDWGNNKGLGNHWAHIVVIILSALAVIINLILMIARKTSAYGIIIALLINIINAILFIMVDNCNVSKYALFIHIIAQAIVLIIWLIINHNKHDDEDNKGPENQLPSDNPNIDSQEPAIVDKTIEDIQEKPKKKQIINLGKKHKSKYDSDCVSDIERDANDYLNNRSI